MPYLRRNLMALYDGQPYADEAERMENYAECDRVMIALHRLQKEGKVTYRRLAGYHGGGGGCSDPEIKKIFEEKMAKDLATAHYDTFPQDGWWPRPSPNGPPPVEVSKDDPNRVYTYVWCWHGKEEFMPWHRPYLAEFERAMQDYDPRYSDERRYGEDALGLPYFAWEGWGGVTLPQPISNPVYYMKSDEFKDKGYGIGSTIRNPFARWWAPVSLEDQVNEKFCDKFTSANCTTRAAAFSEPDETFTKNWEVNTHISKGNTVYSMKHCVVCSMSNDDWQEVSHNQGKGASALNFENPHNKFHGRTGGMMKGGTKGHGTHNFYYTGVPKLDSEGNPELNDDGTPVWKSSTWNGNMNTNQSAFDPLFFLHHNNVERQFCSWQKAHAHKGGKSQPSEETMKEVMYPWTKPSLLFDEGKLSYNTPSSEETDATLGDWWVHDTLPYRFDKYLKPQHEIDDIPETKVLKATFFFPKNEFEPGEFTVTHTDQAGDKCVIGSMSNISNEGGNCARCASRKLGKIAFYLRDDHFGSEEEVKQAFGNKEFHLTRDDEAIHIVDVEAEYENSKLPGLIDAIVMKDDE